MFSLLVLISDFVPFPPFPSVYLILFISIWILFFPLFFVVNDKEK